MNDELILKIADLMNEESTAFVRLDSTTAQLSAALALGELEKIESLTRLGESELLRMRSRLLEITSALTDFSEIRGKQNPSLPLEPQVREQFDTAAKNLLQVARHFQKIVKRAASLASGGSTFANACIEKCGLPPTTYQAPVLRYAEGAVR